MDGYLFKGNQHASPEFPLERRLSGICIVKDSEDILVEAKLRRAWRTNIISCD